MANLAISSRRRNFCFLNLLNLALSPFCDDICPRSSNLRLNAALNVDGALELAPDYNVAPQTMQPVIVWDEQYEHIRTHRRVSAARRAHSLRPIDAEISRLQQAHRLLAGSTSTPKKGHVISAEARARISAAQKKRWAQQKKAAKL